MTYKTYEVTNSVILNQYLKYDVNPCNTVGDIKQNHWTIKYSTLTQKYYEVTQCIILNQHPKYDLNPSNGIGDFKQNQWTMKYRSH